jgi:YYY domain-containing protein
MIPTLTWWLAIEVLGLAAFPIAFSFFNRLPDRGYAFGKALGLLLVGYSLWIGAILGVLPNSRGSIVFLVVLLFVVSFAVAGRHREEIAAFLRTEWGYVLLVEALFAAALATAMFLRSYVSDIASTEKPMDFAYVNGILRSEQFPATDPWFAGHSLSMYHLGHLMVAMLTELTGLRSSFGFNLGLASTFALAAVAAFGLVYNLVRGRGSSGRAIFFGFAAVVLLLIIGNLEGFFEILAAHGLGSEGFYAKIDVEGLDKPSSSNAWYPTDWWWWWRATRPSTIWDWREVPIFSFILGDLHAHVLAIPFVLMAMAAALAFFRSNDPLKADVQPELPRRLWNGLGLRALLRTESPGWFAATCGGFAFWVAHPGRLAVSCVMLGALGFINSWDLPTFLLLLVLMALVLNYMREGKLGGAVLGQTLGFALPLAALSVLAYLPFYVGFKWDFPPIYRAFHPVGAGIHPLEAAGKDWPPVAATASRPHHFLYHWGPLLWLAVSFAIASIRWRELKSQIILWAGLPAVIPIGLWAFMIFARRGPSGFADEVSARSAGWVTAALLVVSLTLVTLALLQSVMATDRERQTSLIFGLAAAATGILILLGIEFYWVQDPVGVRSNTVFRLTYQSWILLAIADAFGLYYMWSQRRVRRALAVAGQSAWALATFIILGAAMIYPVTATFARTNGFECPTAEPCQHVDGLAYVKTWDPEEYEAIRWIDDNIKGTPTILEAVGDSYSSAGHGRISSRTGLPTLLGWPWHEYRWRGSWGVLGTRREDTERIYTTASVAEAQALLRQYGVTYVYVGPLEKNTYGEEGLAKFAQFMEAIFHNDKVTIYRMPQAAAAQPPVVTTASSDNR